MQHIEKQVVCEDETELKLENRETESVLLIRETFDIETFRGRRGRNKQKKNNMSQEKKKQSRKLKRKMLS